MTTERSGAGRLLGRREALKKGAAALAALTAAGAVMGRARAEEGGRGTGLGQLIRDWLDLAHEIGDRGDRIRENEGSFTPERQHMVLQGFLFLIGGPYSKQGYQ
jgi:hypothetical protein